MPLMQKHIWNGKTNLLESCFGAGNLGDGAICGIWGLTPCPPLSSRPCLCYTTYRISFRKQQLMIQSVYIETVGVYVR